MVWEIFAGRAALIVRNLISAITFEGCAVVQFI